MKSSGTRLLRGAQGDGKSRNSGLHKTRLEVTWPGKRAFRSPWRKIWSWQERMVYVCPVGALQGMGGVNMGWRGVCVCVQVTDGVGVLERGLLESEWRE